MIRSIIRKIQFPVFVVVGVGSLIYPEIRTLVRGGPLGSGITDIVVGVLTILLYVGLEVIARASPSESVTWAETWATVALLTVVIGINAVLIYAIPDSLEAVGMLVVCTVGALLFLVDPNGARSSPQS
jgi:hypothetical protein